MTQHIPRIRFEAYGPGASEQPQPGHHIVGLPQHFGPDRPPQWHDIRRELMQDRPFLSWVGGVVVGPTEAAGTYDVLYSDSDRADQSKGYRAPSRIALRWEEMIRVVVEGEDANTPSQDVEPA